MPQQEQTPHFPKNSPPINAATMPSMFKDLVTTPQPDVDASTAEQGQPVSRKIRARLQAAGQRFHANDNIAAFIEPGELEQLLDEVEHKMQGVLDSMVIDTVHDHNTQNTARRVAKMYLQEVFKGRYVAQPKLTEFPNAEHLNELLIVGPITVRSACSHHLCPVIGKVWIGVLPNQNSNVIGLSNYARLVDWIMGRPQIQEEAIMQLADAIMEKTRPDGLAVVMECSHFCMSWRGVRERESNMLSTGMRAALAALCSAPLWALAAPAGWYWWHSRLDSDLRVCAQFMPSQGWERRGGPFDNP